jgi:hypothetical protein
MAMYQYQYQRNGKWRKANNQNVNEMKIISM